MQTAYRIVLGVFLSLGANGSAGAQDLVWAKQFAGEEGTSADGVALDAGGNVYSSGYFFGTTDFDPGPGVANLVSQGSTDVFVSKLDSDGNLIWVGQLGGPENDQAPAIALDNDGDVYIVGEFRDVADFDPGPGLFNLTADGAVADIFVARLNSDGSFVWAKRLGGPGDDRGYDIALDSSGDVYSVGQFSDTADFDPGTGVYTLATDGSKDVFVSKLSSSGDFIWAKQLGGSGTVWATSVAVDLDGNVYTVGRVRGTADFDPGPGVLNLTGEGSGPGAGDAFVCKLDAQGNLVWVGLLGGSSSNTSAGGCAIDGDGAIVTVGSFSGTADFDPGSGVSELTAIGGADAFVSRLDGNGDLAWVRQIGTAAVDRGINVGMDHEGSSYTVGHSSSNGFVWKIDSAGSLVWAVQMLGGSGSNDSAQSIAADGSGNVYSVGFFTGTTDFDPGAGSLDLISGGSSDGFVWKLTSGTVCNDADADGVSDCDGDCNDGNNAVFPGASESCDGVDNQCPGDPGHGQRDEGYPDTDGDTWADCVDNCPMTANLDQSDVDADQKGDVCDSETCGDGIDNDGDGDEDEGCGASGDGSPVIGRIRFAGGQGEPPALIWNTVARACKKRFLLPDECISQLVPGGEFSFEGMPDGQYSIEATLTYFFVEFCEGNYTLDCTETTVSNWAGDDSSGHPITISDGVVLGPTDVVFPRPLVLVRGIDFPCADPIDAAEYWEDAFELLTEKDGLFGRSQGEKEFITFIARNISGVASHVENSESLSTFLASLRDDWLTTRTDANVHVDLLAHSMGGTIARHYLADYPADSAGSTTGRVDLSHLVMMGTPNAGLSRDLAAVLPLVPACETTALRELGPLPRKLFNLAYPDWEPGNPRNIMGDVRYVYLAGSGELADLAGWLLGRVETIVPNDGVVALQSVVPWHVPDAPDGDAPTNTTFRQGTQILRDLQSVSGDATHGICTEDGHTSYNNEDTLKEVEDRLLGRPGSPPQCEAATTTAEPAIAGPTPPSEIMVVVDSVATMGQPATIETFDVAVDAMPSVRFLALWGAGSVEIDLFDPLGASITSQTSDPDVSYSTWTYAGRSAVSYEISDPPAGTWQIQATYGEDYVSAPWGLRATVEGISDLQLAAEAGQDVYYQGETIVAQAYLVDGLGPASGAACTVEDADTISPPVFVLHDDGAAPDIVANDGYYTGTAGPAPSAGHHRLLVRCGGSAPGHGPFSRVDVDEYFVPATSGTFTDAYAELLVDADGNGEAEQLAIQVEIDFDELGIYTLASDLTDMAGTVLTSASTTTEIATAGSTWITLAFHGPAIRTHGIDGPYELRDLLLLESATSTVPVDERLIAWTTSALLADDFEAGDLDSDGVPDDSDVCPAFADPAQDDGDLDGVGDVCDNCPNAPNAGQEDPDQDGVGDACDNCVAVSNPDQSDGNGNGIGDLCDPDADSDGVPGAEDCAPYSSATSELPAEVIDLVLGPGYGDLSWSYPPGSPQGGLFRYRLVRGHIGDLREDDGFNRALCLESAAPTTSFQDVEVPAQDVGWYYLVGAANACGGGSYGARSDGQPRFVSACP